MTSGAQTPHPQHRSVRIIVDQIVPKLAAQVGGELPQGELVLWGEVLEQRGGNTCYLQLLDSQKDDAVLEATLPSTGSNPSVGEMIGLAGRLTATNDGASIQVFFAATRIEETHEKSKRRADLERLLNELKAPGKQPQQVGPVRRMVLVSSEGSRAVSDFENVLNRNRQIPVDWQVERVTLTDPTLIAKGIRAAAVAGVDVIVVTRGGGSPASLMPFNAPEVVRAIAEVAAQVPVITALGHHADQTASDLVASHVESTPTSAAHFVLSLARRQSAVASLQADTAATRTRAPVRSARARLTMSLKRLWAYAMRATLIASLIAIGWCGGVLWSWWSMRAKPGPPASLSTAPRTSPDATAPAKATAKPHR